MILMGALLFVSLLRLLSLSNGSLRMRTDPSSCSTCPQTLANTNLLDGQCAVHRTCVSCTSTQVVYSHSDQCLIASVSCPSPPSSPRVRLLKTDNTYVDITYNNAALSLSCVNDSSWTYTDGRVGTITDIKKTICFGNVPGFQQSPIPLNSSTAVHTSLYNASQFKMSYGSGIIDHINVIRGYGGFHAEMKSNAAAFFTASHLDARYRLVQYHGHWNKNTSMRGSEHTLNGIEYNAEFHFVHIREDFASLQEAVGADGVAVVALLALISEVDNPLLAPLIDSIDRWTTNNPDLSSGNIPDGEKVLLQDPAILFPSDHSYLTYTGSLTTADFNVCVSWNVLTTAIPISVRQLNILGQLIGMNVRELAMIDSRTTVYTSHVTNSRKGIVEEQEKSEKELEKEKITLKPSSSFDQKEIDDEEDENELDGIEISKEELEILHRLRQKYINRKSELRWNQIEWRR